MLQPIDDLNKWYTSKDPWKYEINPEDAKRKQILLSEIPDLNYKRVLDIGCGEGYVTKDLPGESILGVDISDKAIQRAIQLQNQRITFETCSIFDLLHNNIGEFDLIVITGVLYPQYIGNSYCLINFIIDQLLMPSGILVSVHIDSWYNGKFPYLLLKEHYYNYRNYTHKLEVFIK